MSIIITESNLRKIIVQCINEQRGVYYDRKLNSKIINKLFYLVKYDCDTIPFKYDGYVYNLTVKPFLNGNFYDENSNAFAGCRRIGEQIEISINSKILNKYRNGIKSYDDYSDFVKSQVYKDLDDKLDYVLAHELTHAQAAKWKIDADKAKGLSQIESLFSSNDEDNNNFEKNEATKFEWNIVYWFSPLERQARISQGYVEVKRKIRSVIQKFGDGFVDSIGVNGIFEELYNSTLTNYLYKLYNQVLNSAPEELNNVLTKKSAIFSPRSNNLSSEYKRLISRLNNILEYNKKKLIKVTGMIKDELNNIKNGKRF